MTTNYPRKAKSLFPHSLIFICLSLFVSVAGDCHVKITFTGSCILVGSCEDVDGTKYLQPLAISPIEGVNCNYQKLNFFFKETECTLQIERIDQSGPDTQDDQLADSFNQLQSSMNSESEEQFMGDADRAVLKNCGLEDNLGEFNSLSFQVSDLRLDFVLNPHRLFVI